MKKLLNVPIIGAFVVLLILSFTFREASYYVVIGAFAKETNARKFTGYARNIYLEAFYKLNPDKNLYYVYVMQTSRKEDARNWTWYLKNETGFKDAWVFTETAGDANTFTFFDQAGKRHTSPRYSANELAPQAKDAVALASADASSTYHYGDDTRSLTIDATWNDADKVSYTNNISHNFSGRKTRLAEGDVFTFTAETTEGNTIPADIMLVDYKKARKLTGFQTGEYIGLKGKSKNQEMTLVCDVFGYSVETKVINLGKISRARDVKQNQDGVWEVKFKLKPMQVNEISILYNTVFFPDAAVLQPSSRKQLDELLALMKANPSYKILIHSHCNAGTRRGIKVPAGKSGYFALEGADYKTASDKQLTKQRGETIRSYLVDNGIDGKRIQVFGWGSMDNLVSATSSDTAINDRVEVELLEN